MVFFPKGELSKSPVASATPPLPPCIGDKATAERSDPSSAAVAVTPDRFPTLVCNRLYPEQTAGGHDHAFAGPL